MMGIRSRGARIAARLAGAAILVGTASVAAGCYTTTNVATLAPLHTAYPVSASSQYVDQSGRIVTDDEYEVVRSFSFHHGVEAEPHRATLTALALQPDLDNIMSTTGGDAITGMKVQAIDYDAGSTYQSAGMKLTGWTLGFTGLAVVALGVGIGDEVGSTVTKVGAVTAGIGVVSYVIGAILRRPARWQLEVSGNVVRRNGSAVRRGIARVAR
jgi:hypothetical protein